MRARSSGPGAVGESSSGKGYATRAIRNAGISGTSAAFTTGVPLGTQHISGCAYLICPHKLSIPASAVVVARVSDTARRASFP